MATDGGCDALTDLTARQILDGILKSLKEAAQDVDERRVPLDGRVRLLRESATEPVGKPAIPDAAE